MTSCVAPRLTCPSLSSKLSSSCKIEMLTVSSLKQLRLILSFIRQPSCSQLFVKALGELKGACDKEVFFPLSHLSPSGVHVTRLSQLLVLILYIRLYIYIYTYTLYVYLMNYYRDLLINSRTYRKNYRMPVFRCMFVMRY